MLGPEYKFINPAPFDVTNWDPALTQQVLTAEIAKNPKIDVIVSDFGPSLVGALPLFKKSGRSIPALATSDGNILGCFWTDDHADNPDFKLFTVATGNDNARLAVQWAVARRRAAGRRRRKSSRRPIFENSVTGKPSAVQCRKDLPGDIYLSAQMKRRRPGESDQQVMHLAAPAARSPPGPHDSERPQEVVVQRG